MTETELLARCHWLLRVRWVFAAALAGALALNAAWLRLQNDTMPIWTVAVLIALYNLGLTVWTRRFDASFRADQKEHGGASGRRIEILLFVQMALDALALTAVLRYSGGIENPLAFFYTILML